MVSLNELYDLAEVNYITIDSFDMTEAQSLSCMTRKGSCFIAIDPMQLDTIGDEKVRLAHEIGHCLTGSFYDSSNMLDVRGRHENRADRWSAERLIPWKKLKEAFNQEIVETWELAEYFNVPEYFMNTVFDVYRRQGKI